MFLDGKNIIFDLEGIVINTEPIWDKSQIFFFNEIGLSPPLEKVKMLTTGRSIEDGTKILKTFFDIPINEKELIELRFNIINDLFKGGIEFIDGFLQFLDELNERKIKTCIATSLDKRLFDNMSISKTINELFIDNIFFSSQLGIPSKPNPDIFAYVAKSRNFIPQDCIVIEDSPLGIIAAKKANMACIALTTTFKASLLTHADFIFSSYEEIITFFQK